MSLDSYKKASLDILAYLEEEPTIFILNSLLFRMVMALGSPKRNYECSTFEHLDLLGLIPTIYQDIRSCIPHPLEGDLSKDHFVTELISTYNTVWIPVSALDYQITNEDEIDLSTLKEWQKILRARKSTSLNELVVLSIDPSTLVRNAARKSLKTI